MTRLFALILCLFLISFAGAEERSPNIVVIFMDDMGYADIGPFGATAYPTPHLDRMAKEGRKFTDFYVTQAVCSASRAGLLTGCYNVRVGILGALGPKSSHGIHANEVTIAEICKQKGYATACYGKWHLGRPRAKGFPRPPCGRGDNRRNLQAEGLRHCLLRQMAPRPS